MKRSKKFRNRTTIIVLRLLLLLKNIATVYDINISLVVILCRAIHDVFKQKHLSKFDSRIGWW